MTDIHIHENTLTRRLSSLGYAYLRPKHDLTSLQDKDAKERAKEMIDELKKKAEAGRNRPILCGRNHNRLTLYHHSLLDEARSAKAYSDTGSTKKSGISLVPTIGGLMNYFT